MKNVKFLYFILVYTIISGYTYNLALTTDSLLIEGQITGQENGLVTIFYQSKSNVFVRDTSKILNGEFKFKGEIVQPTMVSLRGMVKNQSDDDVNAVTFFVDPNEKLKIKLRKDEFKDAKIEGSKTQVEFQNYNLATANLDFDSLLNYNYNYIKDNTGSYVSIFTLNIFKQFWSIDSCLSVFNLLNEEIRNSIIGKGVNRELRLISNTRRGKIPDNFKRKTLNGKEIELIDFKGKVVLLDFWASWCLPCRKGNPELITLYNKYHKKGFEIISITSDDNFLAWKKAVEKDKIGIWYHVSSDFFDGRKINDNGSNIGDRYGIQVLPTQILIGKNGYILERLSANNTINNLKDKLEEAFR